MGAVLLKSILCVEKTVRNNRKSLTGKKETVSIFREIW